jgi:hypothetical protein
LNAALTRAQRYLFMVGNINAWRSELSLLGDSYRAKKLCYFSIDFLDLGDVIYVKDAPNALPADKEELALNNRAEWSRKTPRAPTRLSRHCF